MMDNHERTPIPVDRPRPTIFASTLVILLACVGLWVASAVTLLIAPGSSGTAQDTLMNALYYLPFVLLPIALYMRRRRGLSAAMRLNPMPVLPTLTVIFLAILSVYAASAVDSLWTLGLNRLGLREPDIQLSLDSSRSLMLSIINTAAIPAICEELLFRGLALSAWESRGTKLAVWVSSALFMLMHGNLYGFPAYLMVGAISAFLVFALDSLYAGIIYHTVYNSAILVLAYLLADQNAGDAVVSGSLVLSIVTELVVCAAFIATMLSTLNARRRLAGVEAVPRVRERLRGRERALLILTIALMIVTTVVVAGGWA